MDGVCVDLYRVYTRDKKRDHLSGLKHGLFFNLINIVTDTVVGL